MNSYTLLGDIHGEIAVLASLLRQTEESQATIVQMGDFGFSYAWNWLKNDARGKERVHVLGGNHDDYSVCRQVVNYLGDFGDLGDYIPGAEGTFYVRGGLSIDKHLRRENVSWWKEEELTYARAQQAIEAYETMKPHTVITHDCPMTVCHAIHGNVIPSITGEMLQQMFKIHEPVRWFFAHHHVQFERKIGQTFFRCVNINEALEVPFQIS